ncbi:MAG: ABC transporter permease [Clostridiales bacterium]|nr:ABC transporter permease [Clostridiales bacterium]
MLCVSFFGIWELTARLGIIDPFIFSKPSGIIKAAFEMAGTGDLWVDIGVTLGETVLGFILSTVLGTLIAIALWLSEFLRKTLNPYLVILNALPKTALAPIIITAIGNNVRSVIFTALMTSIIVTVLTVLTGFTEVSGDKIKLVKTFGADKIQTLRMVVLPASIPSIINALEINIGLSFVGVVVGEFLVAKSGLGFLIIYSQQTFKMGRVMLSVIILGLLSALMYRAIAALEKRFFNR